MAFVYVIQNTSNGKIYVGVTASSVEERWNKHLSSAKRRVSKLSAAINKYGAAAFNAFAIAQFDDEAAAYRYEELMIRLLDSRNSGYNLAHGGASGVRKEVTVAGVLYESHGAAAQAHNVPYAIFMDRLFKGRTPEQAAGIEPYQRFNGRIEVAGYSFGTLNEAAKALDLDRINVHKRVHKLGWSIEEALELVQRPGTRGKYKRK